MIQLLEFQEILQKNSSETKWIIYHEKCEIWHREFLIIQKTIYGEIACVKILLEKCWQTAFNVNS